MGSNAVEANQAREIGKPVVLLTGFGPFGIHQTNASWEAVKHLSSIEGIEEQLNIQLVTKEIPVEYSYVRDNIPILWQNHKPQVGVC